MMSDKRIVVFHGKSDLTAKKKIKSIITKYIPEAERELGVIHFRDHEVNNKKSTEVTDAVLSLPLGCSVQLVVVWQYHSYFTFQQLKSLITQIPDNVWIVLISDNTLSNEQKNKLSVFPAVEVITEYFVKWDEVRRHLQGFFDRQELNVGREVMDYLVKLFSESPALMDKELEKLADYYSHGQRVTIESLMGVIATDQNEQVAYTVINPFFEKQITITLKKFKDYIKGHGDFHMLISVIIRELILIVKFKEMKSTQISLDKVFRQLGVIYDKPKKSLQTREALFSYTQITKILEECLLIDKSLRQESYLSLEIDKPRVPLKAKLHFERLVTLLA